MVYCNTGTILNKALSKIPDNSDEIRTKALGWLNEIIQDVLNQPREWCFLEDTVVLTITDNKITLPAGVSETVYLKQGEEFFLTPQNQLTDEQVFDLGDDSAAVPIGYTLNADNIVEFHPGAAGTVELKFEAGPEADYADNVDTIFPRVFENLFVTGVRAQYYDYDKDGRYSKEEAKYDFQMSIVKAWDNRRKPIPQLNSQGLIRVPE